MFSAESTAFCMWWRTPLLLLPTSSFSLNSKSRHHPPNTSIMILYCFTSYPSMVLLLLFNSQRSGPYFVAFSSFPFLTVCNPSVMTCFDLWLIIWASTLLALTFWCCSNRGTSQSTCALFASYTGFSFSSEHQGGTSLQGLRLAESQKRVSWGLRYGGSCTRLCKGSTTSQEMSDSFRGLIA